MTLKESKCKFCGASLTIDSSLRTFQCEYCGSTYYLENNGEVEKIIEPEMIVPFEKDNEISKDGLKEYLSELQNSIDIEDVKYLEEKGFILKDKFKWGVIKEKISITRMEKLFIPIYRFEVEFHGDYSLSTPQGNAYIFKNGKLEPKRATSFSQISSREDAFNSICLDFNKVTDDSSFDIFPKASKFLTNNFQFNLEEYLEGIDLHELIKNNKNSSSSINRLKFELTEEQVFEDKIPIKIENKVAEIVSGLLHKNFPDHSRPMIKADIQKKWKTCRKFYYPIFIVEFEYQNKIQYVFIDGHEEDMKQGGVIQLIKGKVNFIKSLKKLKKDFLNLDNLYRKYLRRLKSMFLIYLSLPLVFIWFILPIFDLNLLKHSVLLAGATAGVIITAAAFKKIKRKSGEAKLLNWWYVEYEDIKEKFKQENQNIILSYKTKR